MIIDDIVLGGFEPISLLILIHNKHFGHHEIKSKESVPTQRKTKYTHGVSKHLDRSIVDDGSSPPPRPTLAATTAAYYTLRLSVRERTSVERRAYCAYL